MLILNLHMRPYLAEYARNQYPAGMQDIVRFPAHSLMNHAIVNLLKENPGSIEPNKCGNFRVMVNEGICNLKDIERYNYLSPGDELRIQKYLLLDFNICLHWYMDMQRHYHGVDYKDSAEMFIKKYHVDGLLTSDAVLKKQVRWKQKLKSYRTESVQLKMNFNK